MLTKRPGFFAGLIFAISVLALLGAATAVVRVGQANTYTGGFLNDFSSAKFKLPIATVATLPAAAAGNANQVYLVTDGANLNDCTTGSGSVRVWCVSNASAWIAIPAPTDATLPFTDVTTGNASSTAHGFLIKTPNDGLQSLTGLNSWIVHDRAEAYNSVGQTLTTSTATPITFDTEGYDVGGLHSTSSNPARFVAVSAGYYLATCQIRYTANATGIRTATVVLNGTSNISVTSDIGNGSSQTTVASTTIFPLAAADYIECRGFQASGGDLATIPGDAITYAAIVRLF